MSVAGSPSLLDEASAAVSHAVAATGELRELTIAPAGVPVRVRIAGDALAARLVPGLLPVAAAEPPALTLEAFSGDSGVPLPGAGGELDGPVVAAVMPEHGTASAYDREAGRGVFFTQTVASMPVWEDGAPFAHLLRWGLADHGLAFLHGAAVGGGPGRGALLLGNGGAGKSTTALACLAAGHPVVADDYVLVDGAHRAHRLYGIGKLGAEALAMVPALAAGAGPLRGEKRKAHLRLGERYAAHADLSVLVLLRLGGRTGPPRPVAPGAVVQRVLASTMMQMPGRRAATLRSLAVLARELPAVELPLGPSIDEVVDAVAELVA